MQDIRTRLIEATFEEVFSNGYTGASLSNILKRADTKKGSMYHYFTSKKEMVLSMIEEKITLRIQNNWEILSQRDSNIIDLLLNILNDTKNWDLQKGCPLGNLLQESLDNDEDFAKILNEIVQKWKVLFSNILEKAIKNKELNKEIEIESFSTFLIANIEGALLVAKKDTTNRDFKACMKHLTFYINSYRI
jgi:TetR/AcrR family transcriptional repressor of nem operon